MPYRGRRQTPSRQAAARAKTRRIRRRVIAGLLLLCLLIGGFFVLREFLIFTPEGVRFVLPWQEAREEEIASSAVRPLSDAPEAKPEKRISVDEGELPPAWRGHLRGPVLAVSGRSREEIAADAAAIKAQRYTAAVVEVRTAEGTAATREELLWAAEACKTARLRLTAYISCFRDDAAARAEPELALTDRAGNIFIDYHYSAWLDPADETVQARVLGLCRMAQDCGAEMLILDALCYPYEGNVGIIDYGEEPLTHREVIEAFAAALDEALDVPIGVMIGGDDTLGEGASEQSGQDVTAYEVHFQSLWIRAANQREARTLCRRVRQLTSAGVGAVTDGVWQEDIWLSQ